jgi:molybdate transport system permease protein
VEQGILGLAAFTTLMGVISTLVALPVGIAAAWLLARRSFSGKPVVETLLSLPLVLPPVATGFLLLQLFGLNSVVGRAFDRLGIEVVFTWKAVVLAMAVMSFPLMVLTIRAGFEQVDTRYERVAATLGATPWRVFVTITLPLATRSIVAAAILGFARALGEFGATIVVAGGIPGQTQTLAVAIFNLAESGRDADASRLLLVSIALAFGAMLLANLIQRRKPVA